MAIFNVRTRFEKEQYDLIVKRNKLIRDNEKNKINEQEIRQINNSLEKQKVKTFVKEEIK